MGHHVFFSIAQDEIILVVLGKALKGYGAFFDDWHFIIHSNVGILELNMSWIYDISIWMLNSKNHSFIASIKKTQKLILKKLKYAYREALKE